MAQVQTAVTAGGTVEQAGTVGSAGTVGQTGTVGHAGTVAQVGPGAAGAAARRPAPLLPRLDAIAYGGDYNPEQWPEDVWVSDVALMREAGVNLVSVGIFAWSMLEPRPGRYEFGWLDRVLDLLHEGGIGIDLATPTAAPPPWFLHRHPEARPVTRDGTVLGGGARQSFCPSSPAYAEAAAAITEQLARRYAGHPGLVLWHSHNEYGGANAHCYCAVSAAAFRDWLRERYGDLAALNDAWGTAFWSQRYGDWAEIDVPVVAPSAVNPAQRLDFLRFSADAHLRNFRRERDLLHRLSPGVPVTTNFMLANCKDIDYWRWADEVDVISNDHYLQAERTDNHVELAMCADLTRSVARGRPWMLMEHSTSAVNWQPRNLAKRPGEMRRNSLAHLARGADAVLYFQWRAARSGAEKFHSAMLPHGGTATGLWDDVVRLGADLGRLDEVRDSRVVADVAVVWDWESWWALELEWRPSVDLTFRERVEAYYERLFAAHLTVDFVHPTADLSGYPLVLAPSLYLTTAQAAENLHRYVTAGGTLLVSYFSGIVDAHDAIHPGAYPGALRDVLGVWVEEFLPLGEGASVGLDDGGLDDGGLDDGGPDDGGPDDGGRDGGGRDGGGRADVWTERVHLAGAETVVSYVDGPAAGGPAVTRHRLGGGTAWYVSTRLDGTGLDAVLRRVYADAGVTVRDGVPAEVELVRRRGATADYLVALNHGGRDVTIPGAGVDVLEGTSYADGLPVPAGQVRIVRTAPRAT